MSIAIRRARPDDIGLILSLIRELADYEKLLQEVEATEASIGSALFSGFAAWFTNFPTFSGRPGLFLEDLFVRPSHRGKGIGKALLAYLARECIANGWSRLQWAVLDWNTPSIAFYKSLGAVLMDEWTRCKVTGPALSALANSAPAGSAPSKAAP
jgi:diamine N-acetyltransferase